jgi:hypothetical protein
MLSKEMLMTNDDFFDSQITSEESPMRPLWWRVLVVVISLLLIVALIAMMVLPGLIEASRREHLRHRPTPTFLPSA